MSSCTVYFFAEFSITLLIFPVSFYLFALLKYVFCKGFHFVDVCVPKYTFPSKVLLFYWKLMSVLSASFLVNTLLKSVFFIFLRASIASQYLSYASLIKSQSCFLNYKSVLVISMSTILLIIGWSNAKNYASSRMYVLLLEVQGPLLRKQSRILTQMTGLYCCFSFVWPTMPS